MTQNIQISKKLYDGTILVIGGESFDDFFETMLAVAGGDEEAVNNVIGSFRSTLVPGEMDTAEAELRQAGVLPQGQGYGPPVSSPQPGNYVPQGPPQAQQQGYQQPAAPRQAGGPPPGAAAPLCPNHQAPARWVPPGVSAATNKPYNGFWSCAVSERGDRSCKLPR